ncbi:hypothetical protein C7M84_008848 [Penaeus vannamei]|uniref:CHK kinase-like domain-containing protein n=1 Tax=Penaeus vannamei TaxID=6689 RepID=A0A3R7MCA9_PENVA|nr:hypothetical protein C7M84_008848 [Penaeus vannamei]
MKKVGGYESSITWAESTKSKLREIFEKQMEPCKHQVICHGDAWNNNLLFKYDEDGVPVEVMLVDLQLCRRESFAVDLNYFLYTSLTGDVRKPNLDALLETYRGHFNGVVEAGGAGGEGASVRSKCLADGAGDVPEFVASGDGADDLERVLADCRAKSLEMVDTNPLMRPRFLSVFDELTEAGLIPASGAP